MNQHRESMKPCESSTDRARRSRWPRIKQAISHRQSSIHRNSKRSPLYQRHEPLHVASTHRAVTNADPIEREDRPVATIYKPSSILPNAKPSPRHAITQSQSSKHPNHSNPTSTKQNALIHLPHRRNRHPSTHRRRSRARSKDQSKGIRMPPQHHRPTMLHRPYQPFSSRYQERMYLQ